MTRPPDRKGKAPSSAKADAPRIVCIIGVPRTGSHHLDRLLASCRDFNVQREIFHDKTLDMSDRDRRAIANAAGGGMEDEAALAAWCRAHPPETLERLFENGGRKLLFFKLFPGHLSRQQIAQHLFPRKDVCYLVLRRRPIESYISNRKARLVGVYSKKDTTETKAVLDAGHFATWAHNIRSWYDWQLKALMRHKRPFMEVIYETDLESVPAETALGNILAGLAGMGVPQVEPPAKIFSGERQDKEPDYRNRVGNWAEFEAALSADAERAVLLEWAQATPKKTPLELPKERTGPRRRILCLLPLSRTDANDLRQLLKSCRRFNVKSDIFSRKRLAAEQGRDGSPPVWKDEDIDRILEAGLGDNGNRLLLFTLFAGNLSREQAAAGIFAREDVGYLLLRRRPLESFIAHRLSHPKSGDGANGTGSALVLDARDFLDWAKRTRRWFDWVGRELERRGRPVLELTYETDLENAPTEAVLAHLLSELKRMGFARVPMPERVPYAEARPPQPNYRGRATNWTEFEAELRRDPLHAELLEWAEASPAGRSGGPDAALENETAAP
jgi:hypothetical protein